MNIPKQRDSDVGGFSIVLIVSGNEMIGKFRTSHHKRSELLGILMFSKLLVQCVFFWMQKPYLSDTWWSEDASTCRH